MEFLHLLAGVIIIVPLIAFVIVFALTRKVLGKRAIGLAADVTTVLLFVSIPVSIKAIWDVSTASWLLYSAVLLAIVLLVVEKKRAKELHVTKYIRRTWRTLFLVLSALYATVWAAGLIFMITKFV